MNIIQTSEKSAYAYRSTLKTRYRLNDSWIEKIGAPHKQVPNPHYRSGPAASLYSVERIETYLEEHAEEYVAHLVRCAKGSAAATAASDVKRREKIEWGRAVQVAFSEWPDDMWGNCGRHLISRNTYDGPTPRRIVNMLWHAYSNYEICLRPQTAGWGRKWRTTSSKAASTQRLSRVWQRAELLSIEL